MFPPHRAELVHKGDLKTHPIAIYECAMNGYFKLWSEAATGEKISERE